MANIQKTYNYFIFDWDGTLAKTMHALVDAYKRAFVKRGLLITNKQIKTQIFGNWEEGIRRFAVPGSRRGFEEIVEETNRDIRNPDLYGGVYKALEKLYRRNKKLALITLVERQIVMPALVNHKIDKFFSSIITGSEVIEKKPSPI